jgi:DNA-3-methyladenine glycosylase II
MQRLDTPSDLAAAVESLSTLEPRFAGVVARHGLPPLRHAEPGLESLLRIVTDQLISLKAGEAIWSRLATQFDHFAPETVLRTSLEALRALGLSGAKARTFHAAADAFSAGRFTNIGELSEEEVQQRLLEIPGVGPWTANIYLLMVMRAADAWPAADLALQVAAQDVLGLGERPSTRRMMELGQAWRPYRSAAALLLWRHYRALRGLPQG